MKPTAYKMIININFIIVIIIAAMNNQRLTFATRNYDWTNPREGRMGLGHAKWKHTANDLTAHSSVASIMAVQELSSIKAFNKSLKNLNAKGYMWRDMSHSKGYPGLGILYNPKLYEFDGTIYCTHQLCGMSLDVKPPHPSEVNDIDEGDSPVREFVVYDVHARQTNPTEWLEDMNDIILQIEYDEDDYDLVVVLGDLNASTEKIIEECGEDFYGLLFGLNGEPTTVAGNSLDNIIVPYGAVSLGAPVITPEEENYSHHRVHVALNDEFLGESE